MKILDQNQEVGEIYYYLNLDKFSPKFETYFLKEMGMSQDSFENLQKKLPRELTVLCFIIINPEHRKKGYALKEINHLIQTANEGVILVCETHDSFLLPWYESLGFQVIGMAQNLPIMILNK